MFKFDNEQPQELTPIFDNGAFSLTLNPKKDNGEPRTEDGANSIVFTSKEGKTFTLYMESVTEEVADLELKNTPVEVD